LGKVFGQLKSIRKPRFALFVEVCVDRHGSIQCANMARIGFCNKRPAMKTHCTKTCNFCDGG